MVQIKRFFVYTKNPAKIKIEKTKNSTVMSNCLEFSFQSI